MHAETLVVSGICLQVSCVCVCVHVSVQSGDSIILTIRTEGIQMVLQYAQDTSRRRLDKKGNCEAILTLQNNVTLSTVDTDNEIQEVKHQFSTDNCKTTNSENKSPDVTKSN
jgi:hypothetical protein